jgi:hypothetical protein
MTDRIDNDLAAILTPAPSKGVQFSQGKILSWERGGELRNTIEWRGITLTDIPVVEGVNALALKPGDVVGMLGWSPENAKGLGTWWILGKLSNPGEFVSDLTFFLGQIRFMTNRNPGATQAYFGSTAGTGEPFTVLYYGDDNNQSALGIVNRNLIDIQDPNSNQIFANDAATGFGLAKPYLNYHIIPGFNAEGVGAGAASLWPSTANAAYTEMWIGLNTIWHPKISVGVATSTTGGGNAGWQLSVNNIVIHTQSGGGVASVSIPGWGTDIIPGELATIRINGRIEGGATRAWFGCDRIYGRQT